MRADTNDRPSPRHRLVFPGALLLLIAAAPLLERLPTQAFLPAMVLWVALGAALAWRMILAQVGKDSSVSR